MATFGAFESDREIHSDAVYTVYSARKAGDAAEYAVKHFSLQPTVSEMETVTELEPLLNDIYRARLNAVAIQQKAGAASAFIAPIFETGRDDQGVWYVTRLYPRSANKIISGRVALSQEAFRHIILSVAQGALDLKRSCGRSHGDIQPTNIQISRSEKLAEAEVVLSDPLPGDASEAERYEKADLRSIGELIYQFVLKRTVDFQWVMVPLDATPDWSRMFGRHAPRWLDLCNRLLDPSLSLERVNLETLVRELQPSEMSKKLPRIAAMAAGACVILLAGILGIKGVVSWLRKSGNASYVRMLAEATNSLNSGALLQARGRVDRALQKRSSDAQAIALKKQIADRIEQHYQAAMAAVTNAFRDQDFPKLTNQAALALSLKPADPAASSFLANGIAAIADQARIRAAAKSCDEAKRLALAAEESGNQWPQALKLWEAAQQQCGAEQQVAEGIRFAGVMADAVTKLLQAQGKNTSTFEGARDVTNLCAAAIQEVDGVATITKTAARSAAQTAQKKLAQQLLEQAIVRMAGLARDAECSLVKDLAQKAEDQKDWPSALSRWRDAQAKCPGDPEVQAGFTFAAAMTNSISRLREAQNRANGGAADLQQTTSLCDLVLASLRESEAIATRPVRKTEIELRRAEAEKIRKDAGGLMASFTEKQKCADAKKNAVQAEAAGEWPSALDLWRDAQVKCRGEAGIQNEIAFVATVVEAGKNLLDIQERTNSATRVDLEQATNLCATALKNLQVVEQWALSPARSACLKDRTNTLRRAREAAEQRIARLKQDEDCSQAKMLAQQAEQQKQWRSARDLWTDARRQCQDAQIENDVSFAATIADANDDLVKARQLADGQVASAKQAAELCAKAQSNLFARTKWAIGTIRSDALKKLTDDFLDVKLASDKVLAEDFFRQGDYDSALQLCASHPSSGPLAKLQESIKTERDALGSFQAKFESADYSFIAEIGPYAAKRRFAQLAADANRENGILGEFMALQKANDWRGVLQKAAGFPSAGFLSKKRFDDVLSWARNQSEQNQRLLDTQVRTFDDTLVTLGEKFNVSDVSKLRQPGRKKAGTEGALSDQARSDYFRQIQELETSYKQVGKLAQSNRAEILAKIRRSIENWP